MDPEHRIITRLRPPAALVGWPDAGRFTPRSHRRTLGTDAVWNRSSQQPGASPRSRNLRFSLARLAFRWNLTRRRLASPPRGEGPLLRLRIEGNPSRTRFPECDLRGCFPARSPSVDPRDDHPAEGATRSAVQKSRGSAVLATLSINPCGNFSLTSSVGWHPPLRIVKPQFLASHYY